MHKYNLGSNSFIFCSVECMYQQLGKLLTQLGAIIKYENLLSRTKLLKMVAINVFVLEHNKLKGKLTI